MINSAPLVTTRPTSLWMLLIALVHRPVLLFAGTAITMALTGASYANAISWSNFVIVAVDLITLAILAGLLRGSGRTLGDLFRPRLRETGWGLVCFLIVCLAFLVASFAGNLVAYQGPPPLVTADFQPPLWLGLWSLLPMPITIALAEEGLYRGQLTDQLTPRLGKAGTLLFVATIFALQHAALTPLEPQAQLARFITTFLAGITFGLLRLWRGRIWPLVIAHWLLDVLGLGVPMLMAALA